MERIKKEKQETETMLKQKIIENFPKLSKVNNHQLIDPLKAANHFQGKPYLAIVSLFETKDKQKTTKYIISKGSKVRE